MDLGFLATIDFTTVTFVGLAVLGTVNVITFFKPGLKSEYKFAISVLVALLFSFIPADIGGEIVNRVRDAVAIALAASGTYKVASKAGGK